MATQLDRASEPFPNCAPLDLALAVFVVRLFCVLCVRLPACLSAPVRTCVPFALGGAYRREERSTGVNNSKSVLTTAQSAVAMT